MLQRGIVEIAMALPQYRLHEIARMPLELFFFLLDTIRRRDLSQLRDLIYANFAEHPDKAIAAINAQLERKDEPDEQPLLPSRPDLAFASKLQEGMAIWSAPGELEKARLAAVSKRERMEKILREEGYEAYQREVQRLLIEHDRAREQAASTSAP